MSVGADKLDQHNGFLLTLNMEEEAQIEIMLCINVFVAIHNFSF